MGSILAGSSSSGSVTKAIIELLTGLQASWGLAIGNRSPSLCGSWEAVGPPWPLIFLKKIHFQLIHMTVSKPQVLADCWSDISVPCYVGHFTQIDTLDGLFLPEGYHPRESQRWQSSYSFCNLILGVMSNHFCCILFIKSQLLNLAHIKGRGYIKLGIRRGRDHLE